METQLQQSRSPRISKSRPIITAYSLELQEQLETESPINDESPRKTIISHDDVIIPTLAKKLKMNGQLPYPNHEALLGISDEPDELDKVYKNNIKPRPESGYMDVTDQVENLFEDANDQFEDELQKSTKKRSSVVSYQRRRRKSAPRRPTRRSRPNSRRNSKTYSHVQIQTDDVIITPAIENVPMYDDLKKRDRKSRREEFVFLTKEDEDDIDIEPVTHSESSLVPEQKPVEKIEMSTEITNNSQKDRMVHPVQSNVAP
ncbi:11329_t:CDS:2, partial [Gigaspora rosea]